MGSHSTPEVLTFRVSKRGASLADCQDAEHCLTRPRHGGHSPVHPKGAWDGILGRLRLALSDGASTTSCSGLWARHLAVGSVQDPVDWNLSNQERIVRFQRNLGSLRASWRKEALASFPDPAPWFALTALDRGAFATILRVEVKGRRWWAEGWGDSCLFHLRRGRALCMVPALAPQDFGNHPSLVGSVPGPHDLTLPRTRFGSRGLLEQGDLLLLATDALAAWLAGRSDWGPVLDRIEALHDQADFEAWVQELREHGGLRNDDTTLVVARFP